jgi:hypothetical protein
MDFTVLDALMGCAAGFDSAPERVLKKALIDKGLQADVPYTVSMQGDVDYAAIMALVALKSYDSVSQGDFTYKLNHEQANKTITYLSSRNGGFNGDHAIADILAGILPAVPTITDKSNIW